MNRSDFSFFHPLRVRYSEIDGQGVVYNAHYLTYFDVAITEYLRWLDYAYPLGGDPEAGTDFHLVKALVEYKAPVVYDEEIEVAVRIGRLGTTSVTFILAIYPKDGVDLRSTGEIVWVNTDQKAHKSAPLPARFVEAATVRGEAPV
ncbi:MAG: thioesterase family protein [Bauldia litoralis]